MTFWYCDVDNCTRPAVRTLGDCVLCNRHLCSSHAQTTSHKCPKWEDEKAYDPAAQEAEKNEINAMLGRVNFAALAARASTLRNGIQCTVPSAEYIRADRSSVMGGMNYHLRIDFEDGVVWLARIRRFNATSPPAAVRDYIMQSEYATYRFLERTAVPSPRVFDMALEGPENPVGVGYMLMEKLPGKSLRWHSIPAEQHVKVMEQLADIFIELQRYPFDKMGCLMESETPRIGGFARESLLDLHGGAIQTLGPYERVSAYHTASIQRVLDLILRDELYTDRRVDAYLIHLFVRDLVPRIAPDGSEHEKFFLKHADDKGDHLLVDESGNITGIIDWEWAFTVPASMAFNTPLMLLPVGDFYDGDNSLGTQEMAFADIFARKGHADIAEIIKCGRLQHRFAFCCGYDLADWSGFVGLFRGLRDAVDVDGAMDWEEWKPLALERYQSDTGLQTLIEREKSPFPAT